LTGRKVLSIALTLVFTLNLVNAAKIYASPEPTVMVTRIYNVKEPGGTFLVNITVEDTSDVFMWVIDLKWDSNIIEISTGDPNGLKKRGVYYNIYEGPFLKSLRTTIFLANAINSTGGSITALSAGYMSTTGATASGSGVLATINFTCINVGTTAIEITGPSKASSWRSMLIASTGKEMSHKDVDGVFSENPPPVMPFWTQLWFQTTLVTVGLIVVATAYITFRRKPALQQTGKSS
jgi:hypothetical protein